MGKTFRILAALQIVVVGVALAGCGGGGSKVSNTSYGTTQGQELTDLEKAYKDGLMSKSEYEKARKGIINRYKK